MSSPLNSFPATSRQWSSRHAQSGPRSHRWMKTKPGRFSYACKGERLRSDAYPRHDDGYAAGRAAWLRWQDVDLARQMITVNQNLQRQRGVPGGFVPSEPKTSHSRRTIGLTELAAGALAGHWEQMQRRRAWARARLCTLSGGRSTTRDDRWQVVRPLFDKAGCPHVFRYHDLRQTCATLLLAHGVNVKVVSEMYGARGGPAITLDIYAHVLPHVLR